MNSFVAKIVCLGLLISISFSCVEKAIPNSFQHINLYTDSKDSIDNKFLKAFQKSTKIKVLLHYRTTDFILNKLQKDKYNSNIDAILLLNSANLEKLNHQNALSKLIPGKWEPLFCDPYIFNFPLDTVSLFSSYGQLFADNKARVLLRNEEKLHVKTCLIPTLKNSYPIYDGSQIENKIFHSDSLKGKGIKTIEIGLFSDFRNNNTIVFPDQLYKGSIGIVGGIAIIQGAKNRMNAIKFVEFCDEFSSRKKLAKNLNLFPVLTKSDNKLEKILLFSSSK